MESQQTAFAKYSPHEALINRIAALPKERSLAGIRIVITGIEPNRCRARERAALEALGATVRDEKHAISAATIVLVNRFANPRWADNPRGGRKLERALN